MNIKENLLSPANFILFIVITLVFFSGCKNDDMCSETTWYQDADNDGLGNPGISILDCDKPLGYVSNNSDTDDTKPAAKDQEISVSIESVNIGEAYPIKILLPKEYETDKNLPVVYLLDGLTVNPGNNNGPIFFQELVSYAHDVGLNAILVAVGDNKGAERARDYLASGCGGNDDGFVNFYKFINKELVPYFDEKYESDHTARTLIGVSHAGNFTNNVLFREVQDSIIFHNFISVDPSNCALSYFQERLDSMDLPVDANLKIHISQAEDPAAGILNDLFEEKDFPFLEVDYIFYENEDHYSVADPSIRQGLKFVYGL
jgi:predicted alpha/beta superfamily hydrolase